MNYLRRLQSEQPVLFWLGLALAFWLGFQLLLFVAQLLLGPFGLPGWAPLVLVLVVLVVIARRQQRSRWLRRRRWPGGHARPRRIRPPGPEARHRRPSRAPVPGCRPRVRASG